MAGTSDSGLQFESTEAVIPPPVVRPPPVRRSVAKSPPPTSAPRVTQPLATPPTPPPQSDSAEAADPPVAPWLISVRSTPSCMVSLAVHLLLLVLLALFTISTQTKELETIINSGFESDAPELEQVVELTLDKIEEVEPLPASSLVSSEIEVSDVSQVGSEAAAVAVAEGDLQLDSVGEIGGLFSGDAPGMNESGMAKLKGAEFFGVKASGKKFVFVVDSSNSMKNGKFDAAKQELEYAIRRLSPEQLFYVIFFDHDAERMLFPPETEPETNVVAATSSNIDKFVKWMGTVKNELRTDPFESVKFALSLKPDAIFILSDGKFTDRGQTVKFLENENVIHDPETGYRPRAVIHTIAFWDRTGEEAMQDIAKKHRGTYRFVPPAKK